MFTYFITKYPSDQSNFGSFYSIQIPIVPYTTQELRKITQAEIWHTCKSENTNFQQKPLKCLHYSKAQITPTLKKQSAWQVLERAMKKV